MLLTLTRSCDNMYYNVISTLCLSVIELLSIYNLIICPVLVSVYSTSPETDEFMFMSLQEALGMSLEPSHDHIALKAEAAWFHPALPALSSEVSGASATIRRASV